jgi:hypothetical protein
VHANGQHVRLFVHGRLPARILRQGFGDQGEAGKAAWTIACRVIAIAIAQGGSFKMQSQIQSEPEQDKV